MTTVVCVRKCDLGISVQEWMMSTDHVYIGRDMRWMGGPAGSKWANPFKAKQLGREECIVRYEAYVRGNASLMRALPELRGKVLGCWCKPEACHGDVLARMAYE